MAGKKIASRPPPNQQKTTKSCGFGLRQVTNEALASIEGIRSSMEHFQGRREGHEQVRKGMKANILPFMCVLCVSVCFPQQLLYA